MSIFASLLKSMKNLAMANGLAIGLVVPILSLAMTEAQEEQAKLEIQKIAHAHLKEMGLPLPGLEIVKFEEIQRKGSEESAEDSLLKSQVLAETTLSERMKTKGYVERYSDGAVYLLSLKNDEPTAEYDWDPHDTHLKTDLSKIKIAFPYIDTVLVKQPHIIGFSPMGLWANKKGWTGFTAYFDSPELGICGYTLSNMKEAHGGIRLIDKFIAYDINKKATTLLIEGNETSGFLYVVSWYDPVYMQKLKCATLHFEPIHLPKVVELARKIDNNLNNRLPRI